MTKMQTCECCKTNTFFQHTNKKYCKECGRHISRYICSRLNTALSIIKKFRKELIEQQKEFSEEVK